MMAIFSCWVIPMILLQLQNVAIPQTQDTTEVSALRGADGKASRAGLRLRIQLLSGKSVVLKDDTAGGMPFVAFRYRGYQKTIHSHVVERFRYEGGTFLLVDDSTGKKTGIPGVPAISPDGKRLVATSLDLQGFYDPPLIEIWNMETRRPRRELSFEGRAWSPSDAKWRDSVTIDFAKNVFQQSPITFRQIRGQLRRTAKGWAIAGPPR